MSRPPSGSSSDPSSPSPPPPPAEASGAYRTGSIVCFHAEPGPAAGAPRQHDSRTMLPRSIGQWRPQAVDFEQLFAGIYRQIHDVAHTRHEVGVGIFAVHKQSGRLVASMAVSGRPGRAIGAIIGRHPMADLRLADDACLANRQLALFVHPLTSWDPDRLRYSIVDLRTQQPLRSEDGLRTASVVVEGPFFAEIGDYALLCLPMGERGDFPGDAGDAWACLPERVTLERTIPEAHGERDHIARNLAFDALAQARRPRTDRRSAITSIAPLLAPDERLLSRGEPAVGELTITTHGARTTLGVGEAALQRGILLGRLPRCDGSVVLADGRISRAHLLIRRVGEGLVALDTASMNGTLVLQPALLAGRARLVPMGEHMSLRLADRAEVRWQAAR